MKYLFKAAPITYGLAMSAFGIQQFQYGKFRPWILPPWPEWLSNSPVWAYVAGAGLIVSGLLIIMNKSARNVCLLLGGIFLLLFIFFQAPYQMFIIPYKFHLGLWTNGLKELAFSGGAFTLAGIFPDNSPTGKKKPYVLALLEKFIPIGPAFFSIMLICFGVDHFLYVDGVAQLVPRWIPGHVFWTYLAGVALIGSGLAILFRIKVKLVATLLAVMLILWVFLLHIPRAVSMPQLEDGNEITSVFQALAFSGLAWIISRKQLEKAPALAIQ